MHYPCPLDFNRAWHSCTAQDASHRGDAAVDLAYWQTHAAGYDRHSLSPHKQPLPASHLPTVHQALRWIAQLGGFLNRKNDGEPGVTVIWRGWQRLADIAAAYLAFHPPPTCG